MLDPFYAINEKRYASLSPNPNTEAPVFILGHWRSGTTFVHNVLSCDDSFGCCSTYQTVFPHLMLWGRPFFKRCMSLVMPSERPTDSMALGVDLPQEEEFALSNMTACAHYHFWMFPRRMAEYRDKYLTFTTATEAERQEFMQALDKLIRISLHVTGKSGSSAKSAPYGADQNPARVVSRCKVHLPGPQSLRRIRIHTQFLPQYARLDPVAKHLRRGTGA